MKRTWLSVGLCALALGLGVATARLAASNRARGNDLDHRHRICETQERRNELLGVENDRLEWLVLHGREAEFQTPLPLAGEGALTPDPDN